jgi:NhaP-type Na+/H+ or K+/H+ antiporter
MTGAGQLGNFYLPEEDIEHWTKAAQLFVVVLCGLSLVSNVLGTCIHRCHVTWLPESLVTVCLGMLLGAVMYQSESFGGRDNLNFELTRILFEWMLKLFALPIIIFESGWSLRLRDFISQFGYIMFFAIIGTVISTAVVSQLILLTSSMHGIVTHRVAWTYASLISSVDPVATLATFGHLNVDPLLYILVFGESEINDAVAITLFETLNEPGLKMEMTPACVAKLAWEIIALFFGSFALGLAMGILLVLVLRAAKMRKSPANAIVFILISCFAVYAAGDYLKLSGIIAVLFYAIVMGTYAPLHLSIDSMALASFLLKQTASIADTFIFLFCGVSVVYVRLENLWLGLWMCVFCLIGRAAAIFPLGLLSNGIKFCVRRRLPKERQHMISMKHLFMMWHSGLRGGVSLVLCLGLGSWADEPPNDPNTRRRLTDATFFIVAAYLLVFGGSASFFLKCLGLPLGDQVPEGQMLYMEDDEQGCAWRAFEYLKNRVMAKLLVPRKKREQQDAAPQENALEEVLREAEDAEAREDFGKKRGRRRNMASKDVRVLEAIVDLFGSSDPAHVDEVQDGLEAIMPASPAMSLATDVEAISDLALNRQGAPAQGE